MIYLCDFF